MVEANSFIHWFRGASPYIKAHQGKKVVIALSGEVVDSDDFSSIVQDIALLASLGVKVVLVHGARLQINNVIGDSSTFVDGMRATPEDKLDSVIAAINLVAIEIARQFNIASQSKISGSAHNVAMGNYLTGQPVGVIKGVDLQHTGKLRKVNTAMIESNLDVGQIALVSPIGYSASGALFNLFSEDVAVDVAAQIGADKLIFFTENTDSLPSQLTPNDIVHQDSADEILNLHLKSAQVACRKGVPRVHLIDASIDGALLKELYTAEGEGVLITHAPANALREATERDVSAIMQLIKPLEISGVLKHRSESELKKELSCFWVLEIDSHVIGTFALYPLETESMEVACVTVSPSVQNQGYGQLLIKAAIDKAHSEGARQLFALTTQSAHFFIDQGFECVEQSYLPSTRIVSQARNSKVYRKLL